MAWTAPPTFTNAVLTAAQMNIISADLNETAAAKATQGGSLIVGTGTNTVTERVPDQVTTFANETTTSTAYVNLATVGPNCTVTTGSRAIIGSSSIMYNNTAGQYSATSCAVYTPPSTQTVAADDNWAVIMKSELSTGAGTTGAGTRLHLFFGLISQANLFQLKYRVSGGTGTWDERTVLVIPLLRRTGNTSTSYGPRPEGWVGSSAWICAWRVKRHGWCSPWSAQP